VVILPASALNWVPSSFDEADLKKAKKEGFLPESVAVIFPGDEVVPTPPAGYRVMFLAFPPWFISSCSRIPPWASLCLWHAAASAHAKFSSSYRLFYHSL
jgi:hypothetical protein